jgi:apolipoprotein N-acyltransferase
MTIVLPVVWVALEYARAYVISGFPWFFLAHSQYSRTMLIQIADVTGQYGVSFFVAMVNGVIVDMLRYRMLRSRQLAVSGRRVAASVALVALCGAAMAGYGLWRVSQRTTLPGPAIGIVQHAFPISLYTRGASVEKIFADHLKSGEKFVGTSCDLVIFPETMLPVGMNPEMLQLKVDALGSADLHSLGVLFFGQDAETISDSGLRVALGKIIGREGDPDAETTLLARAQRLADLSQRIGCPILAGGTTIHHNSDPIDDNDRWTARNSALLFDASPLASQIYSKNHLVPFSEYVPFKKSFPKVHRMLRWFVPPVMAQLEPGNSCPSFELSRGADGWWLASAICYEGTFARLTRKILTRGRTKQADVLVNLSNDGWFVYRRGGGSYRGSTEHAQHLVQYCFRAIENRVPVVRAVNTGISGSIDSNGRITGQVAIRFDDYTKLTMVSGTLLLDGEKANESGDTIDRGPQLLVDSRVSLYSSIGDAFAITVSVAAILLAIWMGWSRKEKKDHELRLDT